MEWKQIKQLSEKYWQADTTIEEERALRKNITPSDDPLDPQEVEYFKTIEQFSSAQLSDDFEDRFFEKIESEQKTVSFYHQKWFQLAASVLLMIGMVGGFHSYKERQLARQQEARVAFEIAKSALFMVSDKMSRGSQYTLDGLTKFEETHQKIKTQNFNN
ncbi:hypothetical protein SAMN04488029_0760 [Reichenbachiella faecimaris]|uniref:Uncharacterized protein n=1 Tax=Reichenbachiella faecimaris TaxID=692418 RepID=A0A1W2G6W9_REIFA|nr:hypothetical protein [Reichenbachiella faecimaris]SMD32415.1 hypothetical protein SAMN04488029_0760 [Reichenbachiella faecimaris]